MIKIDAQGFITLKKSINCDHLTIYPDKKCFIQTIAEELKFFCDCKLLNETSQVIVIDNETNKLIDLIPVYELVKTDFNYLKDAKIQTYFQLNLKYNFIIYEDIEALNKDIENLEKRRYICF